MPHESVTADVREEAGNVLPIDFPDVEIVKEQEAAYAFLSSVVGEYDATTQKIDAIRKLEQILAAYFIIRPYAPEKATAMYDLFTKLLETVQSGMAGAAADFDFNYSFTDYQSWPAAFNENPDTEVRPYKSTNVFVPP